MVVRDASSIVQYPGVYDETVQEKSAFQERKISTHPMDLNHTDSCK